MILLMWPTENESERREERLGVLRDLIARHARRDETTTAIEGVLVSAAFEAGQPRATTSGTVFALIAQGQKRVAHGDRVMDYGPGQYLVASVDLPITGHYSKATRAEPALGFGLQLRPSTIASLILDEGCSKRSASSYAAAPPGLGVGEAGVELIDAAIRMLQLLDSPQDAPILAPMIEREIIWRLMNGPLASTIRQAGLSDSSLSQISGAVRWISDNYREPFRVEELARTFGFSTSAFHRNFKAVTALSPIQFQKQVRLQRSRLLLVSGDADVTSVAHLVGYDSSTQFSREYKRQFGLPPGKDAARVRAEAQAASA
jgi:AraC-like DNA-binding protein